MVFKVSRTWANPSGTQRGFAMPGAGDQTTGDKRVRPNDNVQRAPIAPTKGRRSWAQPAAPESAQRGFPSPLDNGQRRPDGSMPSEPPIFGGVNMHWTPYYDRGAAAFVPNFGYVLTNPIGAGVVANHRPQASYGVAGQFIDSQIFWTSQVIPTSITPQSLTSPNVLAAILGRLFVYGSMRVAP